MKTDLKSGISGINRKRIVFYIVINGGVVLKIYVICLFAAGYLLLANTGPLWGLEVRKDQGDTVLLEENNGFDYLYASSRKRRLRWEKQEREREALRKQEALKKTRRRKR